MSEEDFYKKLRYNFFGSEDCKDFKELVKAYNDKSKKLELYKSIVNELEKHCETMLSIFAQMTDEQRQEQLDKYKIYDSFLCRLQKLKGSDKE